MGKVYHFEIVKGDIMNDKINNKKNHLDEKEMYNSIVPVLEKYGIEQIPVPIISILNKEGFKVYSDNWTDSNLSGYIAIGDVLIKKFDTNKVVCVNAKDNIGHQRFTAAHELAHYLLDYLPHSQKTYYNTYRTNDNSSSESEKRANMFAANLLMPEDMFINTYIDIKNDRMNIVAELADKFKVSCEAVRRRMKELKLGEEEE